MPQARWFALTLAALWLCTAAASLLSTWPVLSIYGSIWRRDGLITETALTVFTLLVAAWLARSPQNVKLLLRVICIAGIVASLYGIAQYFGIDPLMTPTAYQAGEGVFTIVRPPGTLGHADYFAAWLVFVMFAGLALVHSDSKWLGYSSCVLGSLAIVSTGTRSALLGLMLGGSALLALIRPRVNGRRIVFAAVGLLCALGLILSPAGLRLRARLHWSLDDVRGGARLLLWRDSLRMIAARPVLGFGPETFTTEFPRFQSIDLARAYPDFYHESPHNAFLDVAAGRGLVAAAIFASLCGFALGWTRLATRGSLQMGACLCAGLVAAIVCQLFSVLILPTELYLYLWVALIVSTGIPVQVHSDSETRPRGARALTVIACLLAALFSIFAVRLLIADTALATAQKRLLSGDPIAASSARRTALAWSPPGSTSDLVYSQIAAALSLQAPVFRTHLEASEESLAAAISATRTAEDRANAWYNLAIVLARQGDAAGVERSLQNAIAWAPNWFKPHWTLAQLLEASGRHAEALKQAELAAERNGGKNPEVGATLAQIRAH